MSDEHITEVDYCSVCLNKKAVAIRTKFRTCALVLLGTIVGENVTIANPSGPAMESLVLSSNGTPVTSSTMLTNGQQYWLLADGTYVRDFAGHQCDAEWCEGPTGPPWVEVTGGDPNQDVIVDSTARDWLGSPLPAPDAFLDFGTFLAHTYSSSHLYWLPITGNASTFQVQISDAFTGDNSGSLTVRLFDDVPEGVPTVSDWGLIVMAFLVAVAGGSILAKRRRAAA